MLLETKLKSEVDTSKTEEQSAMLDVVGGLMELGVGGVSLGSRSRRAVSCVGRGGWVHNKAGIVKSINTDDCSTGLHVCREIIIVIYCTGHSSANTRCARIELSKLKLSRLSHGWCKVVTRL